MIYDLPPIIIFSAENTATPALTPALTPEKNSAQAPAETAQKNFLNSLQQTQDLNFFQGQNSAQISSMGTGQAISLRGFGDNAVSDISITYNGIALNPISLSGSDLNLIPLSLIQDYSLNSYSSSDQNSLGGSISFNTQNNLNNLKTNSPDQTYFSLSQPVPFNQINQHNQTHPLQNITFSQTHFFSNNPQEINNIKLFTFNNFINTQRDFNSTTISQFGLQTFHQDLTHTQEFFIQAGPEYDQYSGALTQEQVSQNRTQIGDMPGDFDSQNLLTSYSSSTQISEYLKTKIILTHLEQNGEGTWFNADLIPQSTYQTNTESSSISPSLIFTNSHQTSVKFSENLTQATYTNTYAFPADSNQISSSTLNQAHQLSADSGFEFKKNLNTFWAIKTGANQIFAHQSDPANPNNSNYSNNPSISIWHLDSLFKINHYWDLSLRREGSYRLPLSDENTDSLPNTELTPETSIDYSATLRFKNNYFFNSSLELYQLNINHEIAYIPANSNNPNNPSPFGANINLPKTQRQGLILNIQENLSSLFNLFKQTSKPWTLSESLSLMNNQFTNTHQTIPWTSPLLISINNNFYFTPKLSWDLQANYTGKLYASGDFNNTGGTFGDYLIINSNLNYQVNSWLISLSLLNLTNKHYFTDVSYASSGNAYYPADGLSALLTASLNV